MSRFACAALAFLLAGAPLAAQSVERRRPAADPRAALHAFVVAALRAGEHLTVQLVGRILPPGVTPPRAQPPRAPLAPPQRPHLISNESYALGLPAVAQFGFSVAGLGDVDGDGVGDLAVGAPYDGLGAVWVFLLNADRSVRAHRRLAAPPSVWSPTYGWAVCALGDVDGNGTPDLAASNPADCHVFVHLLAADGSVLSSVRVSDSVEPPLYGGALDSYGEGLASAGDLDGDGVPELVMGCGVGLGGGGDSPRFYVVFLNANGTVKGFTRTFLGSGGGACGPLGDLDGDGRREVAIRHGTSSLRAYSFAANGSMQWWRSLVPALYPTAAAGVPDWTGDGVPDVAFGHSGHDASRGAYALAGLDATVGVVPGTELFVPGPNGRSALLAPGDRFGASVAMLGDLDGDGEAEIALGAPGTDHGGASSGAVWIGALR